VGKTSFAIQVAEHFNTQIISADSRQCYQELNIGVAKPSIEELNLIHHYFINSHSILQNVNAGVYERYALQAASEIFMHNNIAVIVGGTGLYVNAFCNGMDEIPNISLEIRNNIINNFNEKGLIWLQNDLKNKDVEFWENCEKHNPQRLMRALEVIEATGRSINSFKNKKQVERPFDIIKIGLELPKEKLHQNINTRVDSMVRNGLVDEVQSLTPYQSLNALQTVGYKELFEYFKGNITLQKAIEKIKISTRQYAKRQMTWFKKDTIVQWFDDSKKIDINTLVKQ
jgi:tRNA dimethylallyltransferase